MKKEVATYDKLRYSKKSLLDGISSFLWQNLLSTNYSLGNIMKIWVLMYPKNIIWCLITLEYVKNLDF